MIPSIQFLFQDITKAETDAIVNATDCRLSGGGGVDKAIHVAAGAASMRRALEGKSLKTGQALTTPGFALPAKYVIHTVGPRYSIGQDRAKVYLESAYRSCLEEADRNGLSSVTFCSISTGVYRYPIPEAAQIAISTILTWLREHGSRLSVSFAFLDHRTKRVYEEAYLQIKSQILSGM